MSLGLSAYHAAGGEFVPRFEYNAKSGRMVKVDRTADGAGTIKLDVTMSQPMFAFDLGSIEIGWANFQPGSVPQLVMVPYGQPMPPRPDRNHKAGFRSRTWDGREPAAREFSSTAGVTVNAIEALWDQLTAGPEAAAGRIPVIQLVDVVAIAANRGTNYAPLFRLVQWIDREERILGPRMVASPGQVAPTPPQLSTGFAGGTLAAPPVVPLHHAPSIPLSQWPTAPTVSPPATAPVPAQWPAPAAGMREAA